MQEPASTVATCHHSHRLVTMFMFYMCSETEFHGALGLICNSIVLNSIRKNHTKANDTQDTLSPCYLYGTGRLNHKTQF